MPEVLGNPPSPRTALFWNGTAWQWALVDAAGHLQIDVLSTAMDPLAATAANQALEIAWITALNSLLNALQSVATDRLIVRGEDQLWSYKRAFQDSVSGAISGAGGFLESPSPPDGEVWVVTSIASWDTTSPTTGVSYYLRIAGAMAQFHQYTAALAAAEVYTWDGWKWLEHDDVMRIYFRGGLAADQVGIALTGHTMTKET